MSQDPENGAGMVDGFDETEEITEDDLVVITDDDGNDIECVIMAVIEHEGKQYAMLQPRDQVEDEELEEVDAFVFGFEVDEEGLPVFAPILDDVVFESVCQVFAEV